MGKRHIQRLRRADGLRVPPTKRKIVRRGISTGLPTKAAHRGHVWTWDFISDATVRGSALKMLTILDEHPRECHMMRLERALNAPCGPPTCSPGWHVPSRNTVRRRSCVSDNGPEFIAKEVQRWLAEKQIKTIYIDPGSPGRTASSRASTVASATSASTQEQLWTLTWLPGRTDPGVHSFGVIHDEEPDAQAV